MHILFVCNGNTCRSPMAAALARDRGLDAASAGLCARPGDAAADEAVRLLPNLTTHRARLVDAAALASADVVIALTPAIAGHLRQRFPAWADRVVAWDVADPLGRGREAYEAALRQLQTRLRDFLAAEAAGGVAPAGPGAVASGGRDPGQARA